MLLQHSGLIQQELFYLLQALLGGGGVFTWGRPGKGLHSRLSKHTLMKIMLPKGHYSVIWLIDS